jgi:diacylglycerol kinase (ATP)
MKKNESFSIKARSRSFRYAFEGISDFFRTQHNALIHLFFTVLVFITAITWRVTKMECIALLLSTGFVWVAEIFNTAIEAIMDHVTPEKHPRVKFIKDVSAAAVLVAALTAMAVGSVIFIPKIL